MEELGKRTEMRSVDQQARGVAGGRVHGGGGVARATGAPGGGARGVRCGQRLVPGGRHGGRVRQTRQSANLLPLQQVTWLFLSSLS